MAFKVADSTGGKPVLEPAWVSGDFKVPEPVVIANGIVFALSNGENVNQTREGGVIFAPKQTMLNDAQRKENTERAVLYALDAKTGKVLYQSGNAFDTWVHFSGLALASFCRETVENGAVRLAGALAGLDYHSRSV